MIFFKFFFKVLQDPFEGYKFFGDETSFTDGNVSSTLYGGLWNAYIRSDDHVICISLSTVNVILFIW